MIKLNCLQCKKEFSVKNYRIKTAKFCSYQCAGIFRYPSRRKSLAYDKSGSNHPMWKGGKKINSQGYILIWSPGHPYKDKQQYVREHRLIVEKSIGRYLLPAEVVHHLNHIKNDNRLENLQLLDKKEHDRVSMLERPRIRVIKIKKICPFCQKIFLVYPKSDWRKFCSRNCLSYSRWKNKGKQAFGR